MVKSKGETIMGIIVPFQKPREKTWHHALTREQLARLVRAKVEQEDPLLHYLTYGEERALEEDIQNDLVVLKCLRLIGWCATCVA